MSSLTLPALCLVTDRQLAGERGLAAVVRAAVAGGVNLLQLREPDLGAGELLALGRELQPLLHDRCCLAVNDRLDVALALGAAAVQLGARSLPVAEARGLMGDKMLIGRSVHSLVEAQAAEAEGADYLVLGTIYPSRSHPGREGAGSRLVAQVSRKVRIPVLAIGGINAARVAELRRAGADGVAVISEIIAAESPEQAAAALWQELLRTEKGVTMMKLTINGQEREIDDGLTVGSYLEANQIDPRIVAVEHNGIILQRAKFGEVELREGDVVEIVRMIGGG